MAQRHHLTRVLLHYGRNLFNYYVRFGNPAHRDEIDRRRAVEYYVPGSLLCYVRWEANDYGTQDWRLWVLLCGAPGAEIERIAGVDPGAEVILEATRATGVRRAFQVIDAVEALQIDAAEVSPAYFRHAHQRLLARLPVRPYTLGQHRAYQLGRRRAT